MKAVMRTAQNWYKVEFAIIKSRFNEKIIVVSQHAYSNFAWLDGDCNLSEVIEGCPVHALCETVNV